MPEAILLNEVRDAEYLIKNRNLIINDEDLVLTTNISVNFYLKYKYSIDSISLSSLLTSEQAIKNIKCADRMTAEITGYLDSVYSEKLNGIFNTRNIDYFDSLYSYLIYSQAISCLSIHDSLNRFLSKYNISSLKYFDHGINRGQGSEITLKNMLWVFSELKLVELINNIPQLYVRNNFTTPRIMRIVKLPDLFFRNVVKKMKVCLSRIHSSNGNKNGNTILMISPLYDLSFLSKCLKYDFRIITYDSDSGQFLRQKPNNTVHNPPILDEIKYSNSSDEGHLTLIKQIIINDSIRNFNNTSARICKDLGQLKDIDKGYNIKIGIWGVSPVSGISGLFSTYLLSAGRPVLGAQHGGMLGNTYNDDVYYSDLSKCSDYLSYGFNKSELAKTYPKKDFSQVKIYEFGSTKSSESIGLHKKRIDVLFPVVNTTSLLDCGMKRGSPDNIHSAQVRLIEYLGSLSAHKVMIKPFALSDCNNLSIFPLLHELKNLEVVSDIAFETVLKYYDVRSVLFELCSTSLYEALAYDLEIFVVNTDKVRIIEEKALNELKRRVHYFDNPDDAIKQIDLFLNNKLERKRDNAFYEHHIHKHGSKENILKLIYDLAGGNELRNN